MDSSDKGSLLDFEKNKNHLDLSSAEGKRALYQKIDEFLGNKNGVELPEKRFDNAIEAYTFIENRDLAQTRLAKLYHEKYNRSHEVDTPQLLLKIKHGEVLEIDGKFQSEIDKFKKESKLQEGIEKEKLLALQLSKGLFPENESVIIKSVYQTDTQQHFIEFQSDFNLKNHQGIDARFSEKINNSVTENFVIIFNQKSDSLHLMIPILKESTEIERDFVEQNNGISTENVIFDDISAK